ncbi:hypothetical protein C8R46DRAFT_1320310, partial [Mycena filopes]
LLICATHTYLDGIDPLTSCGLWGVGTLHFHGDPVHTECACALYALRRMHRLNIFLSHHGHS